MTRSLCSMVSVYIPSDLAATLESCCVSPAGIWDFLKAKIQDAFHYELHYFADKDGVWDCLWNLQCRS